MNKAELLSIIAEEMGVTRKDTELIVDKFLNTIQEVLSEGDKVVLSGFGTFESRTRVARIGRDPRTGEDIDIPEQKTPAFKAGKALKDAVR